MSTEIKNFNRGDASKCMCGELWLLKTCCVSSGVTACLDEEGQILYQGNFSNINFLVLEKSVLGDYWIRLKVLISGTGKIVYFFQSPRAGGYGLETIIELKG